MQARIIGSEHWFDYEEIPGVMYKWGVVGTKEELKIPDNSEGKPYQWAVSLTKNHPLWGQNHGYTDTLEEAKDEAEKFHAKLYDYGRMSS